MNKKHKEIEFTIANSIDEAMEALKEHKEKGELVCGRFNGHMLYSDTDDIDSAYKKVTGRTKQEHDSILKKRYEEYAEKVRKHEESIPELTKEWIKRGCSVLDEKYHELWKECVPIRLSDLYQGMELGFTLEIVELLNKDISFELAKSVVKKQGHSGMSFGLVCSMIDAFCDKGNEFINYVNNR